MGQLRDEVTKAHEIQKKKEMDEGPKAAFGYGGKFGVQSDRLVEQVINFNKLFILFLQFLLEWINQRLAMIMLHRNSNMPLKLIIVLGLEVNMVCNQIGLIRYLLFNYVL